MSFTFTWNTEFDSRAHTHTHHHTTHNTLIDLLFKADYFFTWSWRHWFVVECARAQIPHSVNNVIAVVRSAVFLFLCQLFKTDLLRLMYRFYSHRCRLNDECSSSVNWKYNNYTWFFFFRFVLFIVFARTYETKQCLHVNPLKIFRLCE